MWKLPVPIRSITGLLLGLLLAVRLLAPAGFMPTFDHGSVTIVVCPDASGGEPMVAHHHDGHSRLAHEHCPYASASGLSSLLPDLPVLAALMVLAAALLLGRTYRFIERNRAHERPPLRGPPIPA